MRVGNLNICGFGYLSIKSTMIKFMIYSRLRLKQVKLIIIMRVANRMQIKDLISKGSKKVIKD